MMKFPKTKIIINPHVKIANYHGLQMILSCIIHVLMVKNLTVNLPMSIKVKCSRAFQWVLTCSAKYIMITTLTILFTFIKDAVRKTYSELVKKREDFTGFATDVRLDYFFHMFSCMFIITFHFNTHAGI